VTSSQLRHRKT